MDKPSIQPRQAGSPSVSKRLGARPARIPSRVVLGGDTEVVIVHGNEEYRLRVTDDGGLILSR
jgi:hemin uptake protein HemP